MSNTTESLISRAKHIVENGGLLARDTSLALIAALEQSNKLKETFRIQSNMFCADANELKARVEDLESQRKLAFMTSNRWSDKFKDAEKRITELESTLEREREKSRRVMSRNHQLEASQKAVKLPRLAAVMWHLSAQAKRRTTAENVSDVLEAIRAAGITVQGDE